MSLNFSVSDTYYSHVDVSFNENVSGITGYKLGYSETQGNYITDTYIPVSDIVVSVVNGNRRDSQTGNIYKMEDHDMTKGFAEITLTRGKTYTFTNIAQVSHPLKFTTLDNLGSSTYLGTTDGITEPASGENTITYKVPVTAPDELHYKCDLHPFMGSGPGNGGIKIVNRKVSTTIEINVTVSNNKFLFDGVEQPTVKFVKGNTYRFKQDDSSNSGNRLRLHHVEDGGSRVVRPGAELGGATQPDISGNAGQSGSYVEITILDDTISTIYYYSFDTADYGGVINVIDQENYSMRKLNPITKHYIVLNTKTSGTGVASTNYTTNNPGSGEATLPSPPYDLIQRGGHDTRIDLSFNTIVLNNLNSGASIYAFKLQTPVRGLVSSERPTYIYPKGIVYNGDVNKLGSEGPWDLEIRYDQGKSYFMYDGHNPGGSGTLFLVRGKTYRFKMVGATTTEESFIPKTSWIGDNVRRDWIFNGSGFITGSNPSTNDVTKYVHNIKYFIFTVSKYFNNSSGYSDYVYPFYKSSGITIRVVDNLNDTIQHLWYESSVHKFRNYFFDMRARYVDDISRNPILGDITITYPEYYKFDIENVTSTLTKKEPSEYFVNFSADVTETNINLSWVKGDINTVDIDISNNGTSFTSLTTKNSSDSYQITGLQNNQISQFKIKGYYGKTFEFAPIVSTNGAQQDISWPAINDLSGNYEIWKKENSGSSLEFVQSTSSTSISGLNNAYEWKIKGDYNDHPGEYLVSGHIKTSASHPNQLFYEGFETRFFGQTINKPDVILGGSTYGGLYSLTGANSNNFTWNQHVSNGTLPSGIKSISFWYKSTSPSQSNARILSVNGNILVFEVRNDKNGLSPRVIDSYPILNRSIFVNGTLQTVSTLGTVNDIWLSPFSHVNGVESAGVGFDNNWYHIYVDFKNSFNITSLHWMGGSVTSWRATNVFIDEIRFFDRHLTTKEIQNLSVGGIGKLSIAGDLTLDQFLPLTDAKLDKIDISLNREIGITTNFRTVDLCGNFVVTVDGVNNEISDISANNNILTLTLQDSFGKDDVVKVTYTKKTASNEKYKNIMDNAGNELANIAETTLTNNITIGPPEPPANITIVSPAVGDGNDSFGIQFTQITDAAAHYNVQYSLNGVDGWTDIPEGPSNKTYNGWDQNSASGYVWSQERVPVGVRNSPTAKIWVRVNAGSLINGVRLFGEYTSTSTFMGFARMRTQAPTFDKLSAGNEKVTINIESHGLTAYQNTEKYTIIPIINSTGAEQLDLSKNIITSGDTQNDRSSDLNDIEMTGLTNNVAYKFKVIAKLDTDTLGPIVISDVKPVVDKSLTDNYDISGSMNWLGGEANGGSGYPLFAKEHNRTGGTINKTITYLSDFLLNYWSDHMNMFYYKNHLIFIGRPYTANSRKGSDGWNLYVLNITTGEFNFSWGPLTLSDYNSGKNVTRIGGDSMLNFTEVPVLGFLSYIWGGKLTLFGGVYSELTTYNENSVKSLHTTIRFDLDKILSSTFNWNDSKSWVETDPSSAFIPINFGKNPVGAVWSSGTAGVSERMFGLGSLTDNGNFVHFGNFTHTHGFETNNGSTAWNNVFKTKKFSAEAYNAEANWDNVGYSTDDISIFNSSNPAENGPTYMDGSTLKNTHLKDAISFTHNNKFYIYGGQDEGLNIRYDIFEYNPSTRKWKKLSQPTFTNGVPDYTSTSSDVQYDETITNVNLVTRWKHSAVRVGDRIYIHGGTNTVTGASTAVKFEILVLDFTNYTTSNKVKWYKLSGNYPNNIQGQSVSVEDIANSIWNVQMTADPSGNIFVAGGEYHKNETLSSDLTSATTYKALYRQYIVRKIVISGKGVEWSPVRFADYKVERSDDGGSTYTTKKTNHSSNKYLVNPDATATTRIRVTANINESVNSLSSVVTPVGAPLPPTSITVTSPQNPTSNKLDFGIKFNQSTAIGNDSGTLVEYNVEYSLDGTTNWISVPGGPDGPYAYDDWQLDTNGFHWTENNIPNSLKNPHSGKPIPGKIVWIRVRAGATFGGQLLWGNYTTFSTYLGIGVMRIGGALNGLLVPGDEKIRVVLEDSDINYQYVEKYSIIPIEGDSGSPGAIRLDLSKNVSPQTNIPRDINNKANEPLYKTDTGVEITGLTNNQSYHFKLITKMASQTLNPITITNFTLSDKSLTDNYDVVEHLKWHLGSAGNAPLATYQDNDSTNINTISNKFQHWYSGNTKMFYYNNHLILLGRNALQNGTTGSSNYNVLTVNVITGKIKTGIGNPLDSNNNSALRVGNVPETNFRDDSFCGYVGYVWKNKLTAFGGIYGEDRTQTRTAVRFDLDKLTAPDFDFTENSSWDGGNNSTWIPMDVDNSGPYRNFGYGSVTEDGTFLHFGSLFESKGNNAVWASEQHLGVRHINTETFNAQTTIYTYNANEKSDWDNSTISERGPTYDNNGVLTQNMIADGVTFTYGNNLYLYGGKDFGTNIRYDIFEYNSSTRKWKKLSQPTFSNGVPDYATSAEVQYDESITNVNLVTRHQHSAVRIGDKVYIFGGTNTEYGADTALNFEVLVLDFSNYVSNNYVKWYKLDSNYPTELTNLDINNIRFPMMANDPSGNIYITGGTYYKNNTSQLNVSPAILEKYLILKMTIKGKAATWSSIKDATYKIERSDNGGSDYTTKTTAHNSNSYFLASEAESDTKIKVTATITPQKERITASAIPKPPPPPPNDFQVTTGEQDPTDTESATRNPDHVYKFTFTKYQEAHKYDIEMSFDNINYTRVIETGLIIYDPNAGGPMGGYSGPEINPQFTYYLHPGITGYNNQLKEQGNTIWFRIKAAKEVSGTFPYGAPSTPIYKTVPVVKPNILSTEIGNRQIEITWADTGGLSVYTDISGGQWQVFTLNNPSVTVNNFNYTNLYKGTDYEARFKTVKKSSEAYDKVMRPFIFIDTSGNTTKLTWPAIGSVYIVERQVKGTGNFSNITSQLSGSEYTIPSNISPELDPTDVFRVKYTLLVYSDYSTTGVITTLNAAEPPTNMTFTNVTPNSIKVNWVKPASGANPVKYKIRVSTDDTTYTTLSDNYQPTGNNNSYVHNDLIPGTSYYYKVHSIGAPPNDQDSFPLSGNTNTTLQTPILIGIKTYNIDTSGNALAMNNSGRVDISWNAVPGATEYEVHEKLNNGGYSVKQTTSNTSVTIKISHDDPNGARKQYTYKIRAKKGSVLSQFLETSQVEQLAPPPYVNPNHFTQTKKDDIKDAAKSGKVKIDWVLTAGTQSDDATLEVQRKIEGSNTWVTIARNLDKDLKDFKVKRLKNNKNYDFRVKSVDPLRGTVYTDLEGIKVEPAKVRDTFKTILDTTADLPVDVSNAIQDLNDAQLDNNIISKITSEGNLPRDAITTVLEKQKTILNSSLAKTGTPEEKGEKKRKLRTQTMNMLFSIDENLKTIELTKEDLAFDDDDITFDSSKIKKNKIIAIKPDMNKSSLDITLDLQTFDTTDITQGFYLPLDEEDIGNLKFANGNVVRFEKGSDEHANTKNKTFITDLVGTSTITSTRDGFSMTSPDNYALVNDVVTVNGVEILIGSLYDGRAIPVEEDTSVEKRGYFKHPNSMLNQYHYKMSSIRKLDSLTRSNTGMNFILRNSTHTSPYKKWANPTPNNNGSMGRLERLKALHQNAKSHPNDK